jgi:TPP-dependent 2-oxoacid decarboxylase
MVVSNVPEFYSTWRVPKPHANGEINRLHGMLVDLHSRFTRVVAMAELTGSQVVVEVLKREGVDILFGIPGGQALPLFDAFYDSGLQFVLTRHEQGACHMADGYARASGRAGVCAVTSGPGATNIVTGLATACMDSSPVVAITGRVAPVRSVRTRSRRPMPPA